MSMTYEFDGMSTVVEEAVKIEEIFEEVYNDDGNLFLVSNKEFHHEEEGLDFYYRYGIEAIDMDSHTGDATNDIYISLHMIPSPKSLNADVQNDLMDNAGLTLEELLDDDKYTMMDIMSEDLTVKMLEESHQGEPEEDRYDLLSIEHVRDKIEAIGALYESVDALRGFHLDKSWNRVGSSGWDTINSAINGTDILIAISRL